MRNATATALMASLLLAVAPSTLAAQPALAPAAAVTQSTAPPSAPSPTALAAPAQASEAPLAQASPVPTAVDITEARPPQPVGQLKPVLALETGLYINLPANRLYHYEHGKLIAEYPIAIGRPDAPTPTGDFTIVTKVVDPTWYPTDGSPPVPPGPANPLGRRWLGLNLPAYGIHGNNAPHSIGFSASAGCIRLRNEDVEALFERVPLNFPVRIVYEPIELLVDEEGNQFLRKHPDVYGRNKTVNQTLTQLGLPSAWAAELQLGREPTAFRTPVAIGQTVTQGYWVGGELWVGARPVARGLGVEVGYHQGQVTLAGQPIATELGDGAAYARRSHLEAALGGLGGPWVTVQGQPFGRIARWHHGQWHLPLRPVATALGHQIGWQEQGATLDGRPIRGTLIGGSFYVALDEWKRHGFLPNLAPTGIEGHTPNSL